MSDLLDHLGRDTLPDPLLYDFIRWCVDSQARPALAAVLKQAGFMQQAADVYAARNLQALAALCIRAGRDIKQARSNPLQAGLTASPLALSAAEAAVFEFTNLIRAAAEKDFDAESLAFFSARLCGWAGWAKTGFSDPTRKATAEAEARRHQEDHLRDLWQAYAIA